MSVVISSSYVLTDSVSGGGIINENNPVIGYENLVTVTSLSTTSEVDDFPVTNLANPATNLKWKADAAEEVYITVLVDRVDPIDYLAIAKHNLGSGLIPVSVEGLAEEEDDPMTDWFELTTDVLLPNDGPTLFRFELQSLYSIRIRMQAADVIPEIGVMYVGKLLVLQRRMYVGHSPITLNKVAKITNARSEDGNFLGRIVLNTMNQSGVSLQNLTPDWYRTYFDPFVDAAKEYPFFFAWRPGDYPMEVGYCWMTDDPTPENQRSNGMMQVNFKLNGVT